MEIDFLGLISTHSNKDRLEEKSFKDPFSDSGNGGDEIFLSLSSTAYVPNSQRQILDSPEKKTWKFPFNKMIRACSSSSKGRLAYYNQENAPSMEQFCLALASKPLCNHPSTSAAILNDLNKKSANLRDNLPEKGNNTMYRAGNIFTRPSTDARKCTRAGYTPTVAMARTATLAKRSHRLNQARTSHSIGKSLHATNFEAHNLSIIRCNKKNTNMRS